MTRQSYHILYIIGIVTTYSNILAPIVVLTGSLGLLMGRTIPITQFIIILISFYFVSILLALMLQVILTFLSYSRFWIIRYWKANTPPYIEEENTDLPAVDHFEELSIAKAKKHLGISFGVFLLFLPVAWHISVNKPLIVKDIINSPILGIFILLIGLIIQTPTNAQNVADILPSTPETEWDLAVLILLVILPAVPLVVVFENLIDYLLKVKSRLYERVWKIVIGLKDTTANEYRSVNNDRIVAILLIDAITTLFMIIMVYVIITDPH